MRYNAGMIRKASTLASLVVAAACAGAWAWSLGRTGSCIYGDSAYGITEGGLFYVRDSAAVYDVPGCQTQDHSGSLRWQPVVSFPRPKDRIFFIPLWIPFLLSAAYPTITLVHGRLRRWRRRRAGQCIKCGYDLTGNVSGRCPECAMET